ncbi:MAG: hypothetical protein HFE45_02000 [Oscillospiraceae bacterium]|nr:hypothetical protein [Oscillospiraceae bacterium]
MVSKKFLLPVVFAILLLLTIFLHQQAFSQDKDALGTDVSVKVTEIKTGGSRLNPGSLRVTVSYQGEEYRLYGVPSGAHFVMENSKKYRSTVSAVLYDGKMYYDSTSIKLLSDKLYYAALAATFIVFVLICAPLLEKLKK